MCPTQNQNPVTAKAPHEGYAVCQRKVVAFICEQALAKLHNVALSDFKLRLIKHACL